MTDKIMLLRTSSFPLAGLQFVGGISDGSVFLRVLELSEQFGLDKRDFRRFLESRSVESLQAAVLLDGVPALFLREGCTSPSRFVPIAVAILYIKWQGNQGNRRCEDFVTALATTDVTNALHSALGVKLNGAQLEEIRERTFNDLSEIAIEFQRVRIQGTEKHWMSEEKMQEFGAVTEAEMAILGELCFIADKYHYLNRIVPNLAKEKQGVLRQETYSAIDGARKRMQSVCERSGIVYNDPDQTDIIYT